jgi:choline-sulfatase
MVNNRLAKARAARRGPSAYSALILRAFLAGAAVLSTGNASFAQPHPVNVVLITVDTLRADRLGCYGNRSVPTPTADRLARDGVLFARALAQVPLTLPSHVTLLTGTFPMWNGVQDLTTTGLGSGIPTLAEIFKRHGYTTAAFVSSFVLNSMWGLNRGFDVYDDSITPQTEKGAQSSCMERKGAETVDHCLRWLQTHESRPFFLWLHLYDPHAPYDPPEPFKSRFRTRPYDGEVAYADQQVGRLIAFLEAHNSYSAGLVLFTSDHGEGLGEHGEQQHGLFIYNSTIHVPLILKPPATFASSRRTISEVVSTVDIAPTLVQFCDFPTADFASFQGRSLAPLLRSPSPGSSRDAYSESLYPRSSFGWHSLHGVETERYHYIEAPREELYDLQKDPKENRNVTLDQPSIASALRERLRELVRRHGRPEGESKPATAAEVERLRDLRSLGYVGASPAEPLRGDPPGAADPKDRIAFYNLIMRATEFASGGRIPESDVLLTQAALEDTKAYLPPFLLGENALAEGRFRQAEGYYRRTLELNPRYDLAAMGRGEAALRGGNPAEAAKAFQLALELNPRNFLVQLALARANERLNHLDAAAKLERDVLAAHPHHAQAYSDYGVTLVRMKRYEEALPFLLKALELGYRNTMTYNFLGTAYLASGRDLDAVLAYEEAIRLDAKYSAPYGNLALFYARTGQMEKSRQFYQKACALDSELCRELAPRFQ